MLMNLLLMLMKWLSRRVEHAGHWPIQANLLLLLLLLLLIMLSEQWILHLHLWLQLRLWLWLLLLLLQDRHQRSGH